MPQSEYADVYQDQQLHARWESVYRGNPRQDRLNDLEMDRFVAWLKLPPGARVLDAGCGVGDHALRLARRGFRCVGMDISQPILLEARRRAASLGLAPQVSFVCCGLEEIPVRDAAFDAVHCRGVLMHIPRFAAALGEMCRLLKPGGRIVIMENNHKALEIAIVRAARLVRRSSSKIVRTDAGLEFRTDRAGDVPLWRVADIAALQSALQSHGVRPVARFATEFWDINRFPAGLVRNSVIAFNRAWFALRLPARLSVSNAVVGVKEA